MPSDPEKRKRYDEIKENVEATFDYKKNQIAVAITTAKNVKKARAQS